MPAKRPSELALRSAIDLYEDGKFDEAARAIQNAREIWSDPEKEVRIEAHKIAAFSYCVTNRRTQCRRQFDALLRIEPGFQLKPTEAGHPLWGPVFQQAKRASDARKKR
ncbi:MAG: TssQ family T6SS-associated lipoprotein [Burkholderiaceae bacterium]|nr:TssQ family T6SS-associated lipoprotein [Burkholderiaceae bacterium]